MFFGSVKKGQTGRNGVSVQQQDTCAFPFDHTLQGNGGNRVAVSANRLDAAGKAHGKHSCIGDPVTAMQKMINAKQIFFHPTEGIRAAVCIRKDSNSHGKEGL